MLNDDTLRTACHTGSDRLQTIWDLNWTVTFPLNFALNLLGLKLLASKSPVEKWKHVSCFHKVRTFVVLTTAKHQLEMTKQESKSRESSSISFWLASQKRIMLWLCSGKTPGPQFGGGALLTLTTSTFRKEHETSRETWAVRCLAAVLICYLLQRRIERDTERNRI